MTADEMQRLPQHLRRYVVEQDYSRYTPIDQEVWRYIMRQLTDFLSKHAHPCYLDGLAKTGIEIDRIPKISEMSAKLEKFGWRAVPVSGFIPPAAFMELQAHGFLPIASDMRTIGHLMYTPAPDIVHEAAGHAPILIEDEFAAYLKAYAQVARKAIISSEDMAQYEAIRVLSDVKEDPSSTPEQVAAAEEKLEAVAAAISHVSEAAYLGRMNWWTAEYGLIGDLQNPRIYGAGLLSSVGEARSCLTEKVKKIPLTLDCINYTYDITEQQPQLFVTPSFQHLRDVLDQLSRQMAYRVGGLEGLKKAQLAKTVNTAEYASGLQVSGVLKDIISEGNEVSYLQFDGPSQLCIGGHELPGQGKAYHAQGYGSPVGLLAGAAKCLSQMNADELAKHGLAQGKQVALKFKSGVRVEGKVVGLTFSPTGGLVLAAFEACTVTLGSKTLFEPAWGIYDMAIGERITSVFGGPADREAYGESMDFVAKIIPRKVWPPAIVSKHELYTQLRDVRARLKSGALDKAGASAALEKLLVKVESELPHDWLLRLDLYELGRQLPSESWLPRVELELKNLADEDPEAKTPIEDGLRLLH